MGAGDGRAAAAALDALGQGRDVLVFTATGLDDPAVARFNPAIEGPDAVVVNERMGNGLGRVLKGIVEGAGLRRAVISGDDTLGRAAKALGIDAVTVVAKLDLGSPLCRAHGGFEGLEIALKGGQVGPPDIFSAARDGGRGTLGATS